MHFYIDLKQKIADFTPIGSLPSDNEGIVKRQYLDCSNYKVLLVDDNKLNLKIVKKIMENYNMVKKIKIMVSCLAVAFVAALVLMTVSFVQIGKARRVNADYDNQLEQLQTKQSSLKDDIDYLKSEEGQDESARDQGLLPEGEYEITL